jgi:hypothetical protein
MGTVWALPIPAPNKKSGTINPIPAAKAIRHWFNLKAGWDARVSDIDPGAVEMVE